MILEICIAIVTLTFVILTIFIIITLISLKRTLIQTKEMLKKLETKIDPISDETEALLNKSNLLLESFTPLVRAASNLGALIEKTKHSWECHVKPICEDTWQEKTAKIIDLAAGCAWAWQNYKKRR